MVRCVDNNITGRVEEITLRHTAIRTYENKRLIIPNSVMNSSIIENADYQDSRVCTFLEIGVTYESDIARAKELLADVVARQPDFMGHAHAAANRRRRAAGAGCGARAGRERGHAACLALGA